MAEIVINLRMLRSSGIGTYLRHVAPAVVAALPEVRFSLLGDPRELDSLAWSGRSRLRLIPLTARTYSPAEQWGMARLAPAGADLFWSPHYAIPLAWRGRLLVTIHDLNHLALAHMLRPHHRLYARFLFRAAAWRATRVIAVSRFTQTEAVSRLGLPPERITVIPNGVDRPAPGAVPPRPLADPYILFVGNVKPHKNLIALLRAFDRLRSEIPHRLAVVGRNTGLVTRDDRFLREAEKLGDRLCFAGEASDAELDAWYRHAAVLAFPSLYEGFGLPPLEAMSRGCPAVVSRAASMPEVCGEAALYFDPLDPEDLARQLRRVLLDPQTRQTLTRRGLETAQAYAWEKSAQAHVRVFQELLSGSP